MSRSARLIRPCLIGGLIAGLWSLPLAAAAECGVSVTTEAADTGWLLHLRDLCRPYQPLRISYGPVTLDEETGQRGTVSVTLPVLNDGIAAVITGYETPLTVSPPEGAVSTSFLLIKSEGAPTGLLPTIGFAETGPEMALYPLGGTPASLDIPVTPERCGAPLRFSLLRDDWDAAQDIAIDLPDCALAGAVIRLPLPPR